MELSTKMWNWLWVLTLVNCMLAFVGYPSNHTGIILKYLGLSMQFSVVFIMIILAIKGALDKPSKRLKYLLVIHFIWLFFMSIKFLLYCA